MEKQLSSGGLHMANLELCEDESGDEIWELRANDHQLVATGGKNRRTRVHPNFGVRFAKIIANDAKVTDCFQ